MQPKLWSGVQDHAIEQTSFGQNREANPTIHFADIDKFDSVTYLNAGDVLQLPRRFDDSTMVDTQLKDGIIEPLAIRDVASRESIDFPNEAHRIRGDVCMGNTDIHGRTNIISQESELNQVLTTSPFIDDASGMGTTTGSILLPGVSSHIFHSIRSFDDTIAIAFSGTLAITSSVFYRPISTTHIINALAVHDFGMFASSLRSMAAGSTVPNDDMYFSGTDSIAFVDLKSG